MQHASFLQSQNVLVYDVDVMIVAPLSRDKNYGKQKIFATLNIDY